VVPRYTCANFLPIPTYFSACSLKVNGVGVVLSSLFVQSSLLQRKDDGLLTGLGSAP
jgi:hypothetical protein